MISYKRLSVLGMTQISEAGMLNSKPTKKQTSSLPCQIRRDSGLRFHNKSQAYKFQKVAKFGNPPNIRSFDWVSIWQIV